VFVSEIYESFQGEGPFAPTPSLFIRTSGCNLRCSFCDTPFTSWNPEGTQIGLNELADRVLKSTAPHVVLTGGEPMLAPELTERQKSVERPGSSLPLRRLAPLIVPLNAI